MLDETRRPDPLMPPTTSERAAEAASFLAAIDALLPELRSRAAEVEQRGMVPEDIIRSLTGAGVFRALQPRQWGGLELDLAAYYEGMIRLASACTSTGWVARACHQLGQTTPATSWAAARKFRAVFS